MGAVVLTGGALLDDCRAKGSRRERCEAYVHGVIDATTTLAQSAGGNLLCIPTSATMDQIVGSVAGFIASAPAERHMTASSLSIYALQRAYPCPE
ncbi:Rap1a/Tai family immunity protein [Sphingomonas montanisoli]|uniref:Rap1a immunity protein domain-containing protein n=1 Tax=Sphingomonas montanisoli TaxID=2606412 RepID=A0A5D9CA72_9SPHN|nr:Rap1a/Tai family immunity protein [Sphingomonas montanisoli]TZG28062.1 hypothetical protein FYJ91_11095 [Sphingomonas montanisoli]